MKKKEEEEEEMEKHRVWTCLAVCKTTAAVYELQLSVVAVGFCYREHIDSNILTIYNMHKSIAEIFNWLATLLNLT